MSDAPKEIWLDDSAQDSGYASIYDTGNAFMTQYTRADTIPTWSTDMDASKSGKWVVFVKIDPSDGSIEIAHTDLYIHGIEAWYIWGSSDDRKGPWDIVGFTHWRHIDLPT